MYFRFIELGLFIGLIVHFSSSQIIELHDNIDLTRNNVPWLVEFYAPWCGHCRHLEPVYQQVYLTLKSSEIRVAKVDATHCTALSALYEIRGFPSIKFIQGDKVFTHHGDRSRDAIVEFARRANGPSVRLMTTATAFADILHKHEDSVFFMFVGQPDPHNDLYMKFKEVANKLAVLSYFYAGPIHMLPEHMRSIEEPCILVFKDTRYYTFSDSASDDGEKSSLSKWVKTERFRAFPLINGGAFSDMAGLGKRLVIIVVDDVDRKNPLHEKLKQMGKTLATEWPRYRGLFQFVWMEKSDTVNHIAMTTFSLPTILVLDLQTQFHFLPDFKVADITTDLFSSFLDSITGDRAPEYGGTGIGQRIKRMLYETAQTIYAVYDQSIWMALLIFVVPALAIGAVLYALCCMDGADDGHEDVGSDDDADDDKYDAPPPAGATAGVTDGHAKRE